MSGPWVLGILATVVGLTFLAALALCRAAARGDEFAELHARQRRDRVLDGIARRDGLYSFDVPPPAAMDRNQPPTDFDG